MSDRDEPVVVEDRLERRTPGDPRRNARVAVARHGAVPQLVHAAGRGARGFGAPDRRGHDRRPHDWRVHPARSHRRGAGPGRPLSHRHRHAHPQDVQAAGRQPPARSFRASRASGSIASCRRVRICSAAVSHADEVLRDEDHLEIDALQRNIKSNFQQVVSLSPLLSDDLQSLAGNITDPGKLADFIASSLTTLGTAVKQEVLETLDIRARMDIAQPPADQGARGPRARLEDPVAGAVGSRQEPARVLPARAAQGDSEGARRRRRSGQGDRRAARQDRRGRHARAGEERSAARARSALEDAGRRRRVHRVAHLSRLADRAAVGEADRGLDRSEAHEGGARRRPLRPREGQGPRPRVSGRSEAQPGRQGPDPVLPRAPRSGQDVAREVDCQLARQEVRSRLARRHARRGGDPRPPSDLHRRAAGPGDPGPASRRVEEPGLHPRRDRQAWLRLPRRSRRRRCSRCSIPSRTTASATTTSTCRSISPRSCS